MAEWSNAMVLKTIVGETSPRVRIPISPPVFQLHYSYRRVAQLVEHRSPKPGVAGSSPVSSARDYFKKNLLIFLIRRFFSNTFNFSISNSNNYIKFLCKFFIMSHTPQTCIFRFKIKQ